MKNLLAALIVFFGFSILGMAQDVATPVKKSDNKTKVTPGAKTSTQEKTTKMPNSSVKSPSGKKAKTTTGTTTTDKPTNGKTTKMPNSSVKSTSGENAKTTTGTTTTDEQKAGTSSEKLKKDGTPDKRYKSGNSKAPAGPLKKDGTPDMRYNSNKPTK